MFKTLKRGLSLLLTLAMVFSIMVTVAYANEPTSDTAGVSRADFSGRLEVWDDAVLGEWNRVAHNSVTDGTGENQLVFRATSCGSELYTIVEGLYRDTRNVYFISIDGRDGGFTFHGRQNVHFLVANGFLYSAAGNRTDPGVPAISSNVRDYATEFFSNSAVRLERVGMEYHTHWTGMRLRLDQLADSGGNIPAPADIRIAWQGWGTGNVSRTTEQRHLPADGTSLTTVGQFNREARDGVYYPPEDFSLILNPMIGGGGSAGTGAPPAGQVMGYVYVSWRDLSPAPGVIDLDQARVTLFGAYPTNGAGRDQWGSRGGLLNNIFPGYESRGQYISLRLHLDLPQGNQGNAVPGDHPIFPDPNLAGQAQPAQRLAYLNLMNRRVADVPTWVIHDMRWQSNLPNPACPDNIPNRADFDNGDGLFQRMRNPEDVDFIFFQSYRDQQLYTAADPENPLGISAPLTPAQQAGIMDGFYRCAIPNPSRGPDGEHLPDLRICANGCVPYRRPDFNANRDYVTSARGTTQTRLGWLQDQNWGPEGVWYFSPNDISGMVGLGPRYQHHMLAKHHEELVRTLAKEIGDPESSWKVVSQVQLGSLGHWGEWHNWPIEDKDTFPDAEFAHEIVRHYVDAFAGYDNVQIAMRYANWIATKYDLGIFHDQSAQNQHFTLWNTIAGQDLSANNWAPNGWGRGHGTYGQNPPNGTWNGNNTMYNNINANMRNVPAFTGLEGDSWYNSGSSPTRFDIDEYANAARNPTFWMNGGWSGGEWGDNSSNTWHRDLPLLQSGVPAEFGGDWDNHMMNVMRTIYAFRWANTSNLLPRGPNPVVNPEPTTSAATRLLKNNLAAYDNMGYKYVIEEVEIDGTLSRGSTVDVSMVVNNRGVAPFYRDWPFEVSFIDADGNVAHRQVIDEVDITEWMPRHRAINNARPAATAYREVVNAVGETHRVYYRTADQMRNLPIRDVDDPEFIPANDGRNEVSFALTVPANLPEGEHTMAITILDPVLRNNEPAIRFHNLGTRPDGRLVLEPFVVVVEFSGSSPTQLRAALETDNVVLQTRGNLGIFVQHSPFVIPKGRTLTVETVLNVHGTINVEGTLIVLDGGRINNQKGGTINIAEGGRLVNNGHVENVTGSFIVNDGTITNNARFEVRAGTRLTDAGLIDGSTALRINRDAIIVN